MAHHAALFLFQIHFDVAMIMSNNLAFNVVPKISQI